MRIEFESSGLRVFLEPRTRQEKLETGGNYSRSAIPWLRSRRGDRREPSGRRSRFGVRRLGLIGVAAVLAGAEAGVLWQASLRR